jgi:hypothetical protein
MLNSMMFPKAKPAMASCSQSRLGTGGACSLQIGKFQIRLISNGGEECRHFAELHLRGLEGDGDRLARKIHS